MKTYILYIPVFCFFMLILANGCNDENPANNSIITFIPGYSQAEASVCMTLSALAYVNQNNPPSLKDSLRFQLANTTYATRGQWNIDWGPALSHDQSNMMYVVKNVNSTPPTYAIAIRGTDWCFPTNWEEDILVWNLERYPYGSQNDSVSEGSLLGLNMLLSLRDSATGRTLVSYLNNIPQGNNLMYITGHSLGGALATIVTSWFLDNGYGGKFQLKSYTFAAPTIGNSFYADHFNQIISASKSESHRVINPKDLVPRFMSELDSVILQQIPTFIPLSIGGVIIAIDGYLKYYDIVYEHVGIRQNVGTLIPGVCPPNVGFEQYKCWVEFEHDHNNYLALLNAPKVEFYYAPCNWAEPIR